jgi:hypothetical protein
MILLSPIIYASDYIEFLRLIRLLYKNPSMLMHGRSNCYDFIDSIKSICFYPMNVLDTCTKESV